MSKEAADKGGRVLYIVKDLNTFVPGKGWPVEQIFCGWDEFRIKTGINNNFTPETWYYAFDVVSQVYPLPNDVTVYSRSLARHTNVGLKYNNTTSEARLGYYFTNGKIWWARQVPPRDVCGTELIKEVESFVKDDYPVNGKRGSFWFVLQDA